MENQNSMLDLIEVNRLVTNAMTNISSLKDNVISFWSGPAAASYQEILNHSIDFSRLANLLKELECEVEAAMEQLAESKADDGFIQ